MNQLIIDENMEPQELIIQCPDCKTAHLLTKCATQRNHEEGLVEYGLLCPNCQGWTSSYFISDELRQRNERLQVIARLYKTKPSNGRWITYQTMLKAYRNDFEKLQDKYKKGDRSENR